MNTKPLLSVIIPAYNEAANFSRGTLDEVVNFLSRASFSWELIIVNDGSTDSTKQQLASFSQSHSGVLVLNRPHQGKAATIMAGASEAKGDYLLFSDMDQATPISEFSKLLPHLQAGSDVVIGSRANRQGAPLYRQFLAYGMVIFRTVLLRLPYKDTQCGFKAFTASSAKRIFSFLRPLYASHRLSGAAVNPGFDVELLYLARKMNLKITQVPVRWVHQKSERVRFLKDAIAGIRELLLVRYRSLTNAYGRF